MYDKITRFMSYVSVGTVIALIIVMLGTFIKLGMEGYSGVWLLLVLFCLAFFTYYKAFTMRRKRLKKAREMVEQYENEMKIQENSVEAASEVSTEE